MKSAFNPLAMESLAESIVSRLLEEEPEKLSDVERFEGAGLYAIYYIGDFPEYRVVADNNKDDQWALPIYVGKAVPAGARRGIGRRKGPGKVLSNRIIEHRRSVEQAENLDLDDFYVRKLRVEDIWIPLGEYSLINRTKPVWNAVLDGFGNHDPGRGRRKGLCPRWDAVHPGRPWAAMQVQPEPGTVVQLKEAVVDYLDRWPEVSIG